MACRIKTLLQCKHCRHDLEVATVIVDRSASVEYVRALANEFLVEMS